MLASFWLTVMVSTAAGDQTQKRKVVYGKKKTQPKKEPGAELEAQQQEEAETQLREREAEAAKQRVEEVCVEFSSLQRITSEKFSIARLAPKFSLQLSALRSGNCGGKQSCNFVAGVSQMPEGRPRLI